MMESARQELQGRREYMSNDTIKSEPVDQMVVEAAAHSLIIHGFTFMHLGWNTMLRVQRHTGMGS